MYDVDDWMEDERFSDSECLLEDEFDAEAPEYDEELPSCFDCGDCGECRSRYDPQGAYAQDGTYLGKVGPRCEDAGCCGCC